MLIIYFCRRQRRRRSTSGMLEQQTISIDITLSPKVVEQLCRKSDECQVHFGNLQRYTNNGYGKK